MVNHSAEAIIVTCIDFRLQEYINNWISKNFATRTYDRVAFAGCVKNFDTILEQIKISKRLHNIKSVTLINHEDCGAYGEENILDKEIEHQRHSEDLKSASEKIKTEFPDLEVQTFYLHLNGDFESI